MASSSRFNGADAAFFGFEIVRRDPLLFLTLIGVLVAVALSYLVLMSGPTAEFLASMQAIAQSDPENPDLGVMFEAYGDYFGHPGWILWIALWAGVSLAVQGAALRALVLDVRAGPAGLRFGADELRLLPVNVVSYLIGWIVFIIGLILGSVVMGVLGALLGGGALSGVLGSIVFLGSLTVTGWFAALFAPAAAATLGEKRIAIFDAMKIAWPTSWSLFGAHVLLAFIFFVIGCVVIAVLWLLDRDVALLYLGQLGSDYDVESLKALLRSPGYIASQIVSSALSAVVGLFWLAIGAYAYRQNGAAAGFDNARAWTSPKEGGHG